MLTTTLRHMRRLVGAAPGMAGARFSETRPATFGGDAVPRGDLIYRMKAWPQLPESGRTAEVYRMLSVMSSRPVNRQWLLSRSRMDVQQLDALLGQLVADGALEVIDPAGFGVGEPRRALS